MKKRKRAMPKEQQSNLVVAIRLTEQEFKDLRSAADAAGDFYLGTFVKKLVKSAGAIK